MSLAAPVFLSALAALAVPVLLHMLHRGRRRKVRWAMMWLLEQAQTQRVRIVRLKDRLLLLLRLLLIAALVLAFCRPVVRVAADGLFGWIASGRTAILLDASASMQVEDGGVARFERGKRAVAAMLRDLGSERVELLAVTDHVREVASGAAHEVAGRLEELRPSAAGTDLSGALLQLANRPSDEMPERVIVVTDNQANGWVGRTLASRTALQQLGERAAVEIVQVARDLQAWNATPSLLLPYPDPYATLEATSILRAEIQSSGLQRSSQRTVTCTLFVDGSPVEHREVELPAEGTLPLQFGHVFDEPGPHRVELVLDGGDRLAADDARHVVVRVLAEHPVFLVDGSPTTEEPRATWFLRRFLAPNVEGATLPLFAVRDQEPDELVELIAQQGPCILILADVPHLDAPVRDAIEGMVRAGGALIVLPGPGVDIERYTADLHRDGDGMLPAAMRAAEGSPIAAQDTAGLVVDPASVDAERFAMLGSADELAALLAPLRVGRAFTLEPGPGAAVLARLQNGSPWIVERALGRGRVVQFAFGCDCRWSNLPATPALALIDRLLRDLLARTLPSNLLDSGQRLQLLGQQALDEPRLVAPDGARIPMHVRRLPGGGMACESEPLEQAGYYEVESPSSGATTVAVNPRASESQLECLDEAALRLLYPELAFRFRVFGDADGATFEAPSRDVPLRVPLLLLAAALGIAEIILAARFSPVRGGGTP